MAEIALGVVPLIGTALNTYRSLHAHVRAFRHYAKDFNRTTKRLGLQRDRFKLECWILLQSALDDTRIRQLKDGGSQTWVDPEVDAEFERNFKSSYESCLSVIEDISDQLRRFESELQEFNPLIKDQREPNAKPFLQEESLSDTVRRFKNRVHVTVNRRKYEDICKELKESNDDLKDLSEKIERLQKPYVSHRNSLIEGRRQRGDWGAACKARRASAALYQGLQQAWSCEKSPHGHHSMRLFIDLPKPKSLTSTSLTMRMSLSMGNVTTQQRRAVPTAFHLRVDSKDTQWLQEDSVSSAAFDFQLRGNEERRSKRVRMLEASDRAAETLATIVTTRLPGSDVHQGSSSQEAHNNPLKPGSHDLACVLDLCGHISHYCLSRTPQMPQYIGYLDVPDNLRHEFFRSHSPMQVPDENVSLGALLGNLDPRDMNVPQRLKLARAVAITALTYFETPWMKEMWRLGDISLLFASASAQDPNALLNTLHLEVDLRSSKHLLAPCDSSMDVALTPDSSTGLSDDDLLDKGVFNKSLHSLGVALVGIETSQDFDPGNWDDVRNVRKYARGSVFGEKYKAVVEKCFAYNCDLRRQKSHRLAFESIVGSLEDMVASLDLDDVDD